MASAALPFVIDTTKDWCRIVGDSKVEWMGNSPPQGWIFPLRAEIHSEQARRAAPAGGYHSRAIAYEPPDLMPFTQDGKSATGIHDLFVNVQTRVIGPLEAGGLGRSGRPRLIHCFSVNDGGNMNLANWNAAGGSAYFNALFTAGILPTDILGIPVDFGGVGTGGETFDVATGGRPAARVFLQASNDFYESFMASIGCYYFDWFGSNISEPNTILAKIAAVSPTGGALSGLYTFDGNHVVAEPNPGGSVQAALYNGQRMECDIVRDGALEIRYS